MPFCHRCDRLLAEGGRSACSSGASQLLRDQDRPACEHVTALEVFAFNRHMACQNEDEIAWRCRLAKSEGRCGMVLVPRAQCCENSDTWLNNDSSRSHRISEGIREHRKDFSFLAVYIGIVGQSLIDPGLVLLNQ